MFILIILAKATEKSPDDEDEDEEANTAADYQVGDGEEADFEGIWRKRPLAFVPGTVDGLNPPVIGTRLKPNKAIGLGQVCLPHTRCQGEEIEVIGYLQRVGYAAGVSDLGRGEGNDLRAKPAESLRLW